MEKSALKTSAWIRISLSNSKLIENDTPKMKGWHRIEEDERKMKKMKEAWYRNEADERNMKEDEEDKRSMT